MAVVSMIMMIIACAAVAQLPLPFIPKPSGIRAQSCMRCDPHSDVYTHTRQALAIVIAVIVMARLRIP